LWKSHRRAVGCRKSVGPVQISVEWLKFLENQQFTPPTHRRNSTLSSRRYRRCELGIIVYTCCTDIFWFFQNDTVLPSGTFSKLYMDLKKFPRHVDRWCCQQSTDDRRQRITLSAHLCVQRDGRDVARLRQLRLSKDRSHIICWSQSHVLARATEQWHHF